MDTKHSTKTPSKTQIDDLKVITQFSKLEIPEGDDVIHNMCEYGQKIDELWSNAWKALKSLKVDLSELKIKPEERLAEFKKNERETATKLSKNCDDCKNHYRNIMEKHTERCYDCSNYGVGCLFELEFDEHECDLHRRYIEFSGEFASVKFMKYIVKKIRAHRKMKRIILDGANIPIVLNNIVTSYMY